MIRSCSALEEQGSRSSLNPGRSLTDSASRALEQARTVSFNSESVAFEPAISIVPLDS